MVSKLLTLLVLFFIIFDDLKSRSVRVVFFPLLAILLYVTRSFEERPVEILYDLAINLLYLSFLCVTCLLYLRIRYGKILFFQYLGIGDIFFLLCVAIWFDPVYFILFNTASFLVSALLHLVISRISSAYKRINTIPLAGYQSFCFSIILVSGLIEG